MEFFEEFRDKVEQEIREVVVKGSTPLLGLDTMNCYHMGFCDHEGNLQDQTKGKYLRPFFCLATCAALGGNPEQALPAAASIELIHRTRCLTCFRCWDMCAPA